MSWLYDDGCHYCTLGCEVVFEIEERNSKIVPCCVCKIEDGQMTIDDACEICVERIEDGDDDYY